MSFAKEEIINEGSKVIQTGKENGVSYGEWSEIKRAIFPTSVNFECSEIVEYNIAVGETREVRFKVGGKNDDEKRNIVFKLNNSNITLSTSSWSVENEWILKTKITGKAIGDTIITVKVEGRVINTIRIKCISYKDVFSEADAKRLIDEFLLIKPKADAGSSDDISIRNSVAEEYRKNYCVFASSRAFGKLLNDKKNFWIYNDSTNKVTNRVPLTSGTYIGNQLLKINYAKSFFQYDGYSKTVSHMKDYITDKNFNAHAYDVIQISSGRSIYREYFQNQINNKIGYHIFLLTVSDDFHVLTIVVNYQNPCNTTYEIYDQHGLSTSKGALNRIDDGIRRQTSWTFLNDFANRGYNMASYGKTINRLWKIKKI